MPVGLVDKGNGFLKIIITGIEMAHAGSAPCSRLAPARAVPKLLLFDIPRVPGQADFSP